MILCLKMRPNVITKFKLHEQTCQKSLFCLLYCYMKGNFILAFCENVK